jgi:hypothetical protein
MGVKGDVKTDEGVTGGVEASALYTHVEDWVLEEK